MLQVAVESRDVQMAAGAAVDLDSDLLVDSQVLGAVAGEASDVQRAACAAAGAAPGVDSGSDGREDVEAQDVQMAARAEAGLGSDGREVSQVLAKVDADNHYKNRL